VALTTVPLPYGLRDLKVRTNTNGTPGTSVDFPNARTLSFEEAEDFEELRGDDQVVAQRGKGPTVNWDLEGGGISLDALVVIAGGAVTTSGTTPNQKKTYSKLGSDVRPTFQIEGQALSESGGDFHTLIYRCKVTDTISGELADGAFWLTGASGSGIGDYTTNKLYDFVQNETAAAIT
jgi:hypothetical protein